jgi:hypothetical protein
MVEEYFSNEFIEARPSDKSPRGSAFFSQRAIVSRRFSSASLGVSPHDESSISMHFETYTPSSSQIRVVNRYLFIWQISFCYSL